jgi:hypothetical protein
MEWDVAFIIDAAIASASLAKFLLAFARHPHLGRGKSFFDVIPCKPPRRLGAARAAKDFAEEFYVMGSATGGLGKPFREVGVFKLPLLLREPSSAAAR